MFRKIFAVAVLSALTLTSGAIADDSASGITQGFAGGVGLPTGIEGVGRLGYQINNGRIEMGLEGTIAPLLGVAGGAYAHVGVTDKFYLTGSRRHLWVTTFDSDMRSINTTSIGVGKKFGRDSFVEVAYTSNERQHAATCNVENCVPNGTTHANGVMVSVGHAW